MDDLVLVGSPWRADNLSNDLACGSMTDDLSLDGASDYLDFLFRLIQLAGFVSSDGEACVAVQEPSDQTWERVTDRSSELTKPKKRFRKEFSKRRPRLTTDPF